MRPTIFGRLATPINPVMDNAYLDVFWFFCQNRILWQNSVKFFGEQTNPGDSIDYTVPQVSIGSAATTGSIWDYMGIPNANQITAAFAVNALPFRAYSKIWNEWFRDQNLQNSVIENVGDGPDSSNDFTLLRRGKRHDYFTSSLPWPQKGDSVSVPLGTQAPVTGIGIEQSSANATSNVIVRETGSSTVPYPFTSDAAQGLGSLYVRTEDGTGGNPEIYADLTGATASTINQLRQAFQIQRLLERDARGGTRYPELLQSHFGVRDPSLAVHQRPVYLGGGSIRVNITPIAQTSETASGGNTPQGNLSAMGTVAGSNVGFIGSFTEHGILMCLVSVRAELTYQQGLARQFSRQTRYDYYWPVLSHIGEQSVLSKEIYATGEAADEDVWGYQERYAELRYSPNRISGQFRSAAAQTLDPWHWSQNFASRPLLNDTFIQDNPPIARTIAVQDEPEFILDCAFNSRWVRPMPMYGVPGLIDHF
jgi:hypothetical protein